jgi:hypothetical protein
MKRVSYALALLLLAAACKQSPAPQDTYTKYDDLFDRDKPIAFGDDRQVYIFADQKLAAEAIAAVDSSLTRTVLLTVEEPYCSLTPARMAEYDELSKFKNLIFCGILDGKDEVSKHLSQELDKPLLDEVKSSGAELFLVKNHHVRDQMILYLVASDYDALASLARLQSGQIFAMLLQRYKDRLGYQAYQSKVIEAKLFKDLPYTIQIPQVYRLFSNDKAGNFLSFFYQDDRPDRDNPDKYISIHYEQAKQNPVTPDWLLGKRRELADKYFKGDKVLEDKAGFEQVKFAGYDALRLRGAWVNQGIRGGIGGAFQTFAIWHAPTRTAIVVDNIVFFPRGDKLPVLLELEAVSASLKLK